MTQRRRASPATLAELSRRIRDGRRALGLTAEQLAHRSGVTTRHIQALEAGDIGNPGLQSLLQLATALDMSSGEFLRDLLP